MRLSTGGTSFDLSLRVFASESMLFTFAVQTNSSSGHYYSILIWWMNLICALDEKGTFWLYDPLEIRGCYRVFR